MMQRRSCTDNASRLLALIDGVDLDMEEARIADFRFCIEGIVAVIHEAHELAS
jgi:hypothetical protein